MLNKNISSWLAISITIAAAIPVLLLVGLVALPNFYPQEWPEVAPYIPKKGIRITLPKANSQISSPLKITGYVNGDGWNGFEGQVGIVELLDSDGQKIASGILTATTEWMQLPTYFEAILEFRPDKTGDGTLVFHNENPSGFPENNREFRLPVKIGEASQ